MPKASPQLRNQNAGEWSALMEGRTDLSKYQASMRAMYNTVATPQGPSQRRSGTYWHNVVYDETKHSALIPFIFSEEQSNALEFCDLRMRITSESGFQTFAPVAVASVVAQVPFQISVPGHGAAIGDQVYLTGFPLATNKTNVVANVTNVAGNTLTLSGSYSGATGVVAGSYIARLYHIVTPFTEDKVRNIRYLQSVDVVYLFCDGFRNYKLSRFAAFDWRLTVVDYNDGPYMPIDNTGVRLSIDNIGNPVPNMTSNILPSGIVSASSESQPAWNAFDSNPKTWWQSGENQAGTLTYQFPALTVVDGYVLYVSNYNQDGNYSAVDYMPGSWKLYGNTLASGGTFELLDAQTNYVLYENGRSVWFKINNTKAYLRYRLIVSACKRNGGIPVLLGQLVFSSPNVGSIQVTTSSVSAINNGEGFKTTDVGRLIRIKGISDATWRQLRITGYVGATVVNTKLLSEPFLDLEPKLQWRLGYFSDTTGWPTCAAFFEDRMAVGGPSGTPDLVVMSRTGAYEDMQTSTPVDTVLDDSAIAFRITSRRLSRIRWLAEDERGLLIGTGSSEFIIVPADTNEALTSRNIRRRVSTSRGSPPMEPVKVDRQVLFVQAARKTLREFAYVFESDGYKSPSMSLFAAHMGAPKFAQMAFAAEPHSIIWFRCDDGSIKGLTYNRDEDVVGWHRHDFGGVVESICVIPSPTEQVDVLWIVILRTINGVPRRFIERLTRFWDFDMNLLDHAHFVDAGLRYVGAPTDKLYGLPHLEGATVDALVDGVKCRGLVVTNGMVELPVVGSGVTSQIVIGLPFLSFGETARIEAGAGDGTAQGKTKRIHNCFVHVWESYGGEFGVLHEEKKEYEYNPIEYAETFDTLEDAPKLQTDMFKVEMPLGYDKRGALAFRQEDPYPLNVVSIMPQLNTQDR